MIVRTSEDKFTVDENVQILAPGKFWEPTPPVQVVKKEKVEGK
jgi:hypothetical protein